MSTFQPPPTFADVVIISAQGKPQFSPVWLKWFLDLAAVLSSAAAGGGSIQHNSLSGLQGGAANEDYHLTAAIYNAVSAISGALSLLAATLTSGRLQRKRGANVAAANNLTVGTDGDYFRITGNTQVNLLDSSAWQGGADVRLLFTGTPTVKHNQAASTTFWPIRLAGSVDLVCTANTTLHLVLDDTDSAWYEIGRSKA